MSPGSGVGDLPPQLLLVLYTLPTRPGMMVDDIGADIWEKNPQKSNYLSPNYR
jgi:hypothetical protein